LGGGQHQASKGAGPSSIAGTIGLKRGGKREEGRGTNISFPGPAGTNQKGGKGSRNLLQGRADKASRSNLNRRDPSTKKDLEEGERTGGSQGGLREQAKGKEKRRHFHGGN